MMKVLLAALFLLNCGILSTGQKIYLRWRIVVNNRFQSLICFLFAGSKENTWTCGVWLAAEEWQNEPTQAYFVFPKQEPVSCPVNSGAERSIIRPKCKRLGERGL